MEDPRLVVHGLDRVGHGLEHAVILRDRLDEGLAGRVAARLGLGDGQQEVAQGEVGGGRVELGGGRPGQGQRQVELAGPVEAGGHGEDHGPLGVAGGDLAGDALRLGQVGRAPVDGRPAGVRDSNCTS